MRVKTLSEKLIDGAYLNKGITIPVNQEEKRYVVGIKNLYTGNLSAIEHRKITEIDMMINSYIINHGSISGVGSWLDNNILYIDIVQFFDDREEAITTGRKNNEIAIYDAKEQKEILL